MTTKKLYVISDLHIGGEYPKNKSDRGFRICNKVYELSDFIKKISKTDNLVNTEIELVINGDFVDFLAEKWEGDEPWKPFIYDPKQAAERLKTIIDRDKILFDALADFLEAGHQLTILLGNHDIELSFPTVRQVLYKNLRSYRKHLKFIYDGEAYVVGKVLIEHGNRYDGFNVIDHDTFRQLRSNDSRLELKREKPKLSLPAGSLLVSSVMNQIKQDYAFIDLLKPETEAAIPLLLTLAPQYKKHLLKILHLSIKAWLHEPSINSQPRVAKNIAANTNQEILKYITGCNINYRQAESFLREINSTVINPEDEDTKHSRQIASFGKKIEDKIDDWSYLSGLKLLTIDEKKPLVSRLSTLKTALQVLRKDSSFKRDEEPDNSNYLKAAKRLLEGNNFDVVVFGHTHLPKKIKLNNNGTYINTGTWADVMKFPLDIIYLDEYEYTQELEQFVDNIKSNNISSYINHDFKATYAEIDLAENGDVLKAELKDAQEKIT